MRMYVKVMAAVIACILMSGETHSTSATIPATENQSWFKKRKKKPEQEEKTKSDYEKLVEGSKITKGMFAVHQKKNDYYFEIPTSLLGRDLLIVNKLQRVPAELNDAGVNRGVNYENQMVSMEWDKATGKLMFRQQRPLPLASSNGRYLPFGKGQFYLATDCRFQNRSYQSGLHCIGDQSE